MNTENTQSQDVFASIKELYSSTLNHFTQNGGLDEVIGLVKSRYEHNEEVKALIVPVVENLQKLATYVQAKA